MANQYRLIVLTQEYIKDINVNFGDTQEFDIPLGSNIENFISAKQAEIEAEKQTRITAFINSVKNPIEQPQPTKAELENSKIQLQEQLTEINGKLDILNG